MIGEVDPHYLKLRPRKALIRWLSHIFFQGRFATTNHRWLNLFILSHLRFASRLPQLKAVRKPIFIVGTGRSGSTILGKVLSIHRDIAFLNEPKAMWYALDAREDINGHFSSAAARYRLYPSDASSKLIKQAHKLFGFYLAVTLSPRLLDKNPELVFRIPFVKAIFPDAKFIFLVRNGWDTIHSISAWSNKYGKGSGRFREDWWGINRKKWQVIVSELLPDEPLLSGIGPQLDEITDNLQMAAIEWILTMQEGLHYLHGNEQQMLLVRYEDLTGSPQKTICQLLDFCDLPPDQVVLDYACAVLKEKEGKDAVPLPPLIQRAFKSTMQSLGY